MREFYEELASTQDRAIELARAGAPEGTRVVARRQTRGRGRLDHMWASPPGGLYLSILLSTHGVAAPLLPLGIGAHLASEFDRRWRVEPRLKWPNDILVRTAGAPARKLSGILVDEVASPHQGRIAVAGIGVNVALPERGFAPSLDPRPVALEELVRPCPSLTDVEEAVAQAATAAARELQDPAGAGATIELCRRWLYGVGLRVTLDGQPAGTIAALADDGSLVIDRNGEHVTIRTGDVRVEDA